MRMAGGLGLWVAAALVAAGALEARAAEVPHVLIVGPADNYALLIAGVSEGLQASGYADSSKIRLEVQDVKSFAQAKKAIVAALGAGADAIVTIFGQSTRAARDATSTVPVVFAPVADPVRAKYVASARAPGGNLTGIASADQVAVGRRLDAFKEVLPGLRRLAVFFDASSSLDKTILANIQEVAPGRGLTVVPTEVADPDYTREVIQKLDRSQVDAGFFLGDAALRHAGEAIGRAALAKRLPLLVGDPDIRAPAVVAAIGPNQEKMGRMAGAMVARILAGASPATMPVEHPPFDLVVDLAQARALGVEVPGAALAKAARVLR